MTQVSITGSSGFVGKNLIAYLERFQVIAKPLLLRNQENYLIPRDATTVIHLAGKAHDLKKVSIPDEYYRVNYELTRELYNAFLSSDAKKFIFISSVKASADHTGEPLSEETAPDPQTHYGKSKLKAEEYIQNQPLTGGKSYYILRPCMIHGPGNKGNLNLLYQFIRRGIPYPLAAFRNKRSFLSIDNLCFVIKEIAERDDIPSGIYHVADDEALSTNELVELIAQGIGIRSKHWNVNEKLIRVAARIGGRLGLPLNTERLGKLTENYVVSNLKLKRALQRDLPMTAKEGILNTIRSFR